MLRKRMKIQSDTVFTSANISRIVDIASRYKTGDIYFLYENRKANAKSIMGMLSLGVVPGTEITIIAEGDKEAEIIKQIEDFISSVG